MIADVPNLVPRPVDDDSVRSDYLQSLGQFRELAHEVSDRDWSVRTDCPAWDVHDVVAHVVSFEAMLDDGAPGSDPTSGHGDGEVARLNASWVASMRSASTVDLLAELDRLVERRSAELSSISAEEMEAVGWSPVGEVSRNRFLQIRTFDVWFHEQDVREALSTPGGLGGPVAERSLSEIRSALGYVVGRKGGAPDGSSVRFLLDGGPSDGVYGRIDVVVDGRARVVDGLFDEPTVTISTDVATFARLAGGRRDPSLVLDAGLVEVAGDATLGERVIHSLAFVI